MALARGFGEDRTVSIIWLIQKNALKELGIFI